MNEINEMLLQNNYNYKNLELKNGFIIMKINDAELYAINKVLTKDIAWKLNVKFGHIGFRKLRLIF